MTDDGTVYKSKRFSKLLCRLEIRDTRAKPYTPRINAKAERFIQALLRKSA